MTTITKHIPLHISNPVHFVNTRLFQESGLKWTETYNKTGKGVYCSAPVNSKEYNDFWDTEEERIRNGYTVGGVRITGEHYAYLNYGIIKATVSTPTGVKKARGLPRFLDMDYYYYHELELAKLAGEGMIIAKARRKGFSFKGAFSMVYQYAFVRDSYSIVGAYELSYSQATMAMAVDMVNHLDEATAFAKRRLIDKSTSHIKSGYIEFQNGKAIEYGYKSEILCMGFKKTAFKSIGKSASIMLFEEAGKWDTLKASYEISKHLFKDGEIMIGTPIIFGTGGDMEKGTVDFCDMYYSPSAYGLRSYTNVYDENAVGECGYFVSDNWYKLPHVSNEGVSLLDNAKNSTLEKRKGLSGKSKGEQDLNKSQEPQTPQEAFTRSSGSVFPITLLKEQLSEITVKREYSNIVKSGYFKTDLKGKTIYDDDNRPIFIEGKDVMLEYPVKSGTNPKGSVIIIAEPVSKRPNMYDYIGGLDSYDLDKSNTGSLGALCIWKRYKAGDPHNDMLVATYVGRPDKAEEFYQIALDLVIYYNAITMFENQNKGVQVYFENKNKGHMLADTPDLFIKTIISRSTVNRGKGIHMTKAIKDAGEMLLRDWLLTQYTTRGEEIVYNTSKLYERATLQELVAYEDKGNYDRAIALFLIFIFMSNLAKVKAVVNDDEEATPNNWNLKAFITKQRA
jgi:hypothetical protein